MLNRLIYVIEGVILCISVNSLVHSLIDIAVGKALGFELWSFKYLFFDMSTVNHEKKYSIGKFSVYCQHFLSKPDLTKEKEHKNVYATLILTTLADIGLLVAGIHFMRICTDAGKQTLYALLGGIVGYLAAFVVAQWFITIKFMITEEKHLLFYCRMMAQQWVKGMPTEELSLPPYKELGLIAQDAELVQYDSMRFLQKVWMERYEELDEIVREFEPLVEKSDSGYGYIHSFTPAYYNLIFYYSFVKRSDLKARHFYDVISKDLENDTDTNGRRVLAYYHYFVNHDARKAHALIREAWHVMPKFSNCQAERDYEAKLLDILAKVMERDEEQIGNPFDKNTVTAL
ncbi:MAG: hypothetical protein IJ711_12875 [Lachnospiraceae bacterium]|nr:hypothetical protein [Lachnospiraceae bacterium]